MKSTLQPGLRYELVYTLADNRMVPALYPDAPEFVAMPEVFATGYLVGFLEWACICAINPHIDWPREQTLGTHINVSHEAATPAGLTVTAQVELTQVDGRRLVFAVSAHDGVDCIARGTHERTLVDRARFCDKVTRKQLAHSQSH